MSRSGTYKLIHGQMVKVSDKIPCLNDVFNIHFKEDYYSHELGCQITSKAQKKRLMEENNLIERSINDKITRPKPSPETRKRQIEERLNQHLSGLGVEGIKLKDLAETREEEKWVKQPSLAIPG